MQLAETDLSGCYLVRGTASGDQRGYFSRLFSATEFEPLGFEINQSSVSFNAEQGTLRGLHFQSRPHLESKLVRCLAGRIFDVMVDLRPGSPTFGRWTGTELSADNQLGLYSAPGFAHGFQTLTPDALVWYGITPAYRADHAAGVRWDDPDIAVPWPLPPINLSPRDQTLPFLRDLDASRADPT